MSCCAPNGEWTLAMAEPRSADSEVLLASRALAHGLKQSDISVPTIHCGGCIQKIERALGSLPGVELARVNFSSKRVTVRWRGESPPPLIAALNAAGYEAHLYDGGAEDKDYTLRELVRALAISGFAASNIMMLSI